MPSSGKGNVRLLLATIALLLLAAGLAWWSFLRATPAVSRQSVETRLEEQVSLLEKESASVFHGNPWSGGGGALAPDHFFYLFQNGDPVFWTTNDFMPDVQVLTVPDGVRHMKWSGGDFIVEKWTVDSTTVRVGAILLYRRYKISNGYLQPVVNTQVFGGRDVELRDAGMGGAPVRLRGKEVFAVQLTGGSSKGWVATLRWLAVVCAFLGFATVAILMVRWTSYVGRRWPDFGFLLLAAGLIGLRAFMIGSDFPSVWMRTDLFDPQFFASSQVNPSPGDLLLNTIVLLTLCAVLFVRYAHFRIFKFLLSYRLTAFLFRGYAALSCFFAVLFPFIVVQTIYNNSAISLSISDSLHMDALRIVAFLIVVICSVGAFLFNHVFFRLMLRARGDRRFPWGPIALGLVVFILINEYTGQTYLYAVFISLGYITVLYLTRLYRSLHHFSFATFSYLTAGIVCYALMVAIGVRYFVVLKRAQNQSKFASNYLVDRDYLGEYIISDAREKILHDAFIQARLASPFLSKDVIRDKIRQVFLPAYLDRYSTDIFLFDASGRAIDDRGPATLDVILQGVDSANTTTDYKGVYVLASNAPATSQRYVALARIRRSDIDFGTIVMEFSQKRYIPESVYPELLVDYRFQRVQGIRDYSYAVFAGKEMILSYGDFDYERWYNPGWMHLRALFSQGIVRGGYLHVGVTESNGQLAIVSSRVDPLIFELADFSFQLVLGLAVFLSVLFVAGIASLFQGSKLYLAARVQLALNLAFFIPLCAVSLITLTLVSVSFREKLNDEYLSKSRTLSEQMSRLFVEHNPGPTTENELRDWSRVANVDANIYRPDGKLLTTSQPAIFENQLLSGWIDPTAYRSALSGKNNFIVTEHVGNLNYAVSYAALRSPETGQLLGLLGIPFFQSGYSLERMKIIVLSNILTIFSAIFLLLLTASFFVSKWLTFPFKLITQSLGRTSLTRENQPIVWKSNDEIGLMVKEYNEMLVKLQNSRRELERSQRERAWREIAQQVAHEINNPLTPMRLKLQQLERTLGKEQDEGIRKTVESLLEQIETLNRVATSFSALAKMPEPVLKPVGVTMLAQRIVDLHKSSGAVSLEAASTDMTVQADDQLLGRILSNLVLNALQAGRAGIPLRVQVRLARRARTCRIEVSDNGTGISEEVQDHIFLPHFSTKKSGSGLGLAIARQGIEQMGGTISFHSEPGKGTVFVIELPCEA